MNTLAVAWTAFFVGGEVDGEKIVVTSPTDINPHVYLVRQRDYVKNHEIPHPIMTYRKFDFGNAFVEDSRFVYYRFFAYENHDLNIKKFSIAAKFIIYNFSRVGEGLKNFRLREMKNLKGATK